MVRILSYLTLLLIGGLLACSDHRIPAVTPGSTTTRLRVKTIMEDSPTNLAKVSLFRYDAQGRLSSILAYQTPDSTVSEIEYSNYQYDGQNRLTGLRRAVVPYPRPPSGQPYRAEQYFYTYNAAGQLSEINYVNGFRVGFSYNGSGQLASSGRIFGVSGLTLRGSDRFTFTGNNLTILNSERNIPSRGGIDPIVTANTAYTHDDKVNPFYGIYVIPAPSSRFVNLQSGPGSPGTYFGGIDNPLILSQNNVLTEVSTVSFTDQSGTSTSTGLPVTYQYQYNVANLPTVRVKTTTSPAPNNTVTVETLRFEYESY